MRTPTTTAVKHWFEYIESGHLIWKHNVGSVKKGDTAGSVGKNGYLKIQMQGVTYLAHRLIWVWHGNKLDPALELDHIDRDKLNNRIENLRQVCHGKNCENKDYIGQHARFVYKRHAADRHRRPWVAVVKNKYLGGFFTKEEAAQAVECYLSNNEQPDVREPRRSLQAPGGLHTGRDTPPSCDGEQAGVGNNDISRRDAR